MSARNFPSRTSSTWLGVLLVFTLAGVLLAHGAQKKLPEGSVLVVDKGKFNIVVDGKSIGREEFEIVPSAGNWLAKGTTRLSVEGSPAMTVSGTLALQPGGAPISYDWTSQGDKTNGAHIAFDNGIAKITLQMEGARPFEQDLTFNSPLVVVLDNNLYHQYVVLTHIYDWKHRGPQTFSVLVPQQLTPGTISVDWAGAISTEGKTYEGLSVKTSNIEMVLYLDPNHRLMRIEVPASKAAVVRE